MSANRDEGNEVIPGLVLGPIEASSGFVLGKWRITHVLTLIRDFEPPAIEEACVCPRCDSEGVADTPCKFTAFKDHSAPPPGRPARVVSWRVVHVDDIPDADLLSHLPKCCDFLDEVLGPAGSPPKGNVMVHCQAGQSRSATIVLAFLMRRFSFSFHDAVGRVRSARGIIAPNPGFTRQLLMFERMECRVDHDNPEFLEFRVRSHLAELERFWNMSDGLLDASTLGVVQSQPASSGTLCARCRTLLFQRNHVAHNCARGKFLFVEPMRWMHAGEDEHGVCVGQLSDLSGRINCPSCNAKLGFFQWKNDASGKLACNCGEFGLFPLFRVMKEAVRITSGCTS